MSTPLVLLTGIGWTVTSRADSLDFDLTPATLSGAPGDVVSFIGMLLNPGASGLFLNGTSSMLPPPGVTLDDEPFFLNVPLSLTPGGSFTGELFEVRIDMGALPGTYHGTFGILGGNDANAFDLLALADFYVTVTQGGSAPEPSSALLVTLALVLGMARLRRGGIARAR